jgi:polyhydroxyalkanoate synthesis regulator phasin
MRGSMMNFKLRNIVAATLAGTALMSFGTSAMADSTFDLVQALVAKGVLTEEEALPLLKGRDNDIQIADKKVAKKAKIGISDAIDNAKLYGDIRARYEMRSGDDTRAPVVSEDRNRGRYKLTFGVKTEADDFYADLAFAMGSGGRSDNSTFGNGNATPANQNGSNNKESLFVKRAMLGWKATDWLTLEAGRIANPLYTTSMVWDGDLTFEGLAEMLTFDVNPKTQVFANFVQSQYVGDYKDFSNSTLNTVDRVTNNILAFQGGAKFKVTDEVGAKAAITFTKYTNDAPSGITGAFAPAVGTGTALASNVQSTNNLQTIEIPAEISFKAADSNIGFKLFGDYVQNIDGSDRYNAAVAASGADAAKIRAAGNDDSAWLLGVGVDSKQGKSAQKGDWSAKAWYQDVGVYSVDPNAVDSDFMDSRVNMKGVVLKAEYLLRDNVFLNFAAGHATRKNDALAAAGTGGDIGLNLNSFDLYQFDVTYKF